MNRLNGMLEEYPAGRAGVWGDWHQALADYLSEASPDDVSVGDVDLLWTLLGWAEVAASRSVRVVDHALLRLALAVLTIVDTASLLDHRDVLVVAGLLRRAADLVGLDPHEAALEVCRLPVVETMDRSVLGWFSQASPASNSYHREVGRRASFRFERVTRDIDVERLQRRFGEGLAGDVS